MDTRTRILQAAFEVITRNSYAGAGIAEIISTSGMTRGAVYHHFASKQEIGQAVVREVILERYRRYWEKALASAPDAEPMLEALIAGLKNTKLLNCNNGCSLANVYQSVNRESEPQLAETIRQAQREFEGIFIEAVERGLEGGELDASRVDAQTLGPFIAAAFQGAMNAAGVQGGSAKYLKLIGELESYLRGLSEAAVGRRASARRGKKIIRAASR
ncbi:MAG: TetR/AcrR family transcriptional regulator [bacterium]|nr:TetR/AcrR family transcriptional regulator [bacterium]